MEHAGTFHKYSRKSLFGQNAAADMPFFILVLTLLCLGLITLFSASYAVGIYRRGDAYAYIRPQLLYAAVGLAAMWAASLARLSRSRRTRV